MNRREIREILKRFMIIGVQANIDSNNFFKYKQKEYFFVVNFCTIYWGQPKKERGTVPIKLSISYKTVELLITKRVSNVEYINYENIFNLIVPRNNVYNFDISYSIFNIPIDWNKLINKFQLHMIKYL